MLYAEIDLPIAVTPFVRAVWHLHGTASDEPAEAIIPDGCMEIVLNFGDPVRQHGPDTLARVQPVRMIVGQLRAPIVIAPTGKVDIWGIRLQPWAGGAFVGVPAAELAGTAVTLDDPGRSILAEELRAVGSAEGDAVRASLIVRALEHRVAQVALAPNVIALAQRAMSAAGEPTVGTMASWAGLSARRVQMIFSGMVGLSPKSLMRISRFQRALSMARVHPRMTWGAIAARCGYYDHAHLVRDSQQFAGRSPRSVIGEPSTLMEIFLSKERK